LGRRNLNPKYLLELKNRAEKALNQDPPDGLAAFTAAWALWEAVRLRMLILACKRVGWTVEQAQASLKDQLINTPRFMELYAIISGQESWESSLPIPARRLWPDLLTAAELRRRIIDGSTRIGEEKLQKYSWSILRFINRLRQHSVGDPLEKLPKRSRRTRTDESLQERLRQVLGPQDH
jgi:hypothetical protein